MVKRKILMTLELSEIDVNILLEALGVKQSTHPSRAVEILIELIYRKMGVRLDR